MILYHKRTLDIIVSLLGLLLLSPLLLLISLATSYSVGLPVIFKQNRVGLQGKRFLIYKFRTMLDTWHTSYELLNDQQRLTKFGCWLRATSLDELPQLWNVLKGEMSLVGPRPLLVDDLPCCLEAQAKRHSVPPGITGWAQINGRNALPAQDKLSLDLWYIDNHSFWLDCKILLLTIKPVLLRRNI